MKGILFYDGGFYKKLRSYRKGKRQGYGKEYYYKKGELKFEGIFKNDKQWEGKGYNLNNEVVYTLSNGAGYIKEYNEKNIFDI